MHIALVVVFPRIYEFSEEAQSFDDSATEVGLVDFALPLSTVSTPSSFGFFT